MAAEERARLVRDDGSRANLMVEPATNCLVGRLKKDLLGGDLVLGGMITSTYRARVQ